MSAQVKLVIRNPGIPARRAATSGDGRGIAERSRRSAARAASRPRRPVASSPRHGPGSPARGSPAVGRVAVARRIDRPGVRDERPQLDRPRQPLPPVVEEIRVRPDRDRDPPGGSGSPPRPSGSDGRNHGWSRRRPGLLRDRLGSSSMLSASAGRRLDRPQPEVEEDLPDIQDGSTARLADFPALPTRPPTMGTTTGWALAIAIDRSRSGRSSTDASRSTARRRLGTAPARSRQTPASVRRRRRSGSAVRDSPNNQAPQTTVRIGETLLKLATWLASSRRMARFWHGQVDRRDEQGEERQGDPGRRRDLR